MKTFTLFTSLCTAAFASIAGAQGDPSTIERIIDQGKNHSEIMKTLKGLTNIGPRLTSSSRLEKAEQWAMKQFKSYGCQNVHLEKWGEFPVGFDRGSTQVGRMVDPIASDFEFTSPSWSEGTKGLVRARAVLAPTTMEEFEKVKNDLKGAWVIVPKGSAVPRRNETPPAADLENALVSSGMAGRVFGSRNELVVTSGRYQDKTYKDHPRDVRVTVRQSDMDRILRNMEKGPVTLEFNLENHFRRGPISNYNVVAEIPGTEKPNEVVIVSGHLDSWDGPGSQGALDNGTGSSTALEAARILCKAGAKPKRTIRFILWTGEEQGLFGSAGYVKDHAADMPNISAVLVDDGGTNYQGGYNGIESQRQMFETAFAPMNTAFPDMPVKFVVSNKMPRGGGSDHASFNAVGVPGFFTIETGTSNYTFVHHTQHDRYEMAIPAYLVQSGTCHAVVSYNLACAETMVPRQPVEVTPPTTTTPASPPAAAGSTGGTTPPR